MTVDLSYSDRKRGVIIPRDYSKELAELWGIITGDGYIAYYPTSHHYFIEIAGDKVLDKEFLESKVCFLFKELFNYNPSIQLRKNQQTIVLRVLSKSIFTFFKENGFPVGKKEQIGIPDWVKKNNKFFLKFLRGYADTDGCFRLRNGKYPIIRFGSKSELLMKEITCFLKRENFSFTQYYHEARIDKRNNKEYVSFNLYLNGRNNYSHWMKDIGFTNKRHVKKIKEFEKKYGNTGI